MAITLGQRTSSRRLRAGLAAAAIGVAAAAIGLAAAFGVTRVSTAVIIVAALLLGGLFTAIILGRWYLGLVLVFIEAPFDDFIRRIVYFGRQIPHLDPIHLVAEFLVFSLVLGLVLEGVVRRRRGLAVSRPRSLLWLAVAVYFLYLVVQIFNPLNGNVLIGAQGFVSIGYYVLLFLVAARVLRTPQQLRRLLLVSVACATVVALYGIFQHLHGLTPQDKFELDRLQALIGKRNFLYYGNEVRVFSTLGTYSACAGYLCLNVVIATYFLLRGPRRVRLFLVLAMPLMALCLLWTYSRTNWLGVTVGVVLLVALSRPWGPRQKAVLVAFLLLLGIALYGLLGQLGQSSVAVGNPVLQRFGQLTNGQGETSLSQRVAEVGFIVQYVQQNPLGAGVGANLPNTAGNTGAAKLTNVNNDNYYTLLLFEIGYPGLAMFIALAISLVIVGLRNQQRARDRDVQGLGAVLATILIVLLFISLGEPFLNFGGIVEYFWLSAGVLVTLPAVDERAVRAKAGRRGDAPESGAHAPLAAVAGAGRAP